MNFAKLFPVFDWGRGYGAAALSNDLTAAVIVTIMLIPQSLAYALLAGLPPEIGLYASMLPLVGYALFGTSRTLAVGPVAVVSLMTAAAVGNVAAQGTADYLSAAIVLAMLSGIFLMGMGVLRLGFLANFLSHPVISGFITASGLIIAASQLKHILGVKASGHNLYEVGMSLGEHLGEVHWPTLLVGVAATAFLFLVRTYLKPLLIAFRFSPRAADLLTKAGPVFAVVATILAAWALELESLGVAIVGNVPQGLPPMAVAAFDLELWRALAIPAVLISIIGFVESVSVAQTLAAKKRQRIDANQELLGLGAANIAASVSGGYPVTGGFARSVVNFDAGAQTPLAGAFTAGGIALAAIFLTPLLHFLPKATLAATIIIAVLALVDLGAIGRTWVYSKSDFGAMAATILLTLGLGVEAGIVTGVVLSIALHLYRSSKPHCAIMGQVPGTEHFRNVKRHRVVTGEKVVTLRVDESLYFANARFLEDRIYQIVIDHPKISHVVLMCPGVNEIDASALESLEAINHRLADLHVTFHLSEVKGPVMDGLKRTNFPEDLTGKVFLSQFDAFQTLDPEAAETAMNMARDPAAGPNL